MGNLQIEKYLDKKGSKYEAVVRMSIRDRKITEGEIPEGESLKVKPTKIAIQEYFQKFVDKEKSDRAENNEKKKNG